MALTIKEFKINKLKARIGKPLHRMKIPNFYYGDDFTKVPNIRGYGGMRVVKGKFGNYFELDLKDDNTEKFFKILGEQLQSLAGHDENSDFSDFPRSGPRSDFSSFAS